MSLNERFDALMRQHEFLFGKILVPPIRPNPGPTNPRRCFKCQGLGHITSNYPNCNVITLAEWAAMKEEFEEDEKRMILRTTLRKLKKR